MEVAESYTNRVDAVEVQRTRLHEGERQADSYGGGTARRFRFDLRRQLGANMEAITSYVSAMNPWQLIGRAQTPGGGAELVLYQRDSEFSLRADNLELMNSRVYGSEEAMARLGCQNLAKRPRARVLIGGLGMGYSVRTALDILGEDARVVVAELVPAVVEWNRGVLADLAGRPLADRRTELHEADVVQLITAARGDYDVIMLDVDNGAEAMVRKGNKWLYSLPGLTATYAALRRGGVLAIWSAGSQPPFVRRLRRAGFEVDEVKVRARGGSSREGGAHHVVWVATRG